MTMKIWKNFIVLAWRNILRNTRRSILTGMVIMLGIMFVFTARGFINGLQKEIRENISKGEVGEIQVTKAGFREALPARAMDYLFPFDEQLRREILAVPGVTGLTARLQFGGMINHQKSQTTTPFIAVAINPEEERKVCPRLQDLVKSGEGKFLESGLEKEAVLLAENKTDIEDAPLDDQVDFSKPVSPQSAKNMQSAQSEFHQVLISKIMQSGLKMTDGGKTVTARLGDEMVLITQDLNGSQRSLRGNLAGLLNSPNPTAAKMIIYMVLKSAQKLIGADNMVTQAVISINNPDARKDIAAALNRALASRGLVAEPWDEVNKFFSMIMNLQNGLFSVIMSIIILFVIVAIIITSMMTVAERTREIGALMAIGYKRFHILSLFLLESGMIGFLGGVAGLLFGSTAILIAGWIGVPFTVPGTDMPILIRPENGISFIISTVFLGLISGVIGSLYPAQRASKLSPLEAMVHI